VLLPIRPNGSTGWIRSSDVTIAPTTHRIRVELGARRITVTDAGTVTYRGPVAAGAADTPTPTGEYYLRVLLQAPDPDTAYGPFAYGLSSHSDALETFNGGDAEIGIHGNNDASVLGTDITHGCVRMGNAAITELAKKLPLGTPVDIVA
jgi:lipoprotein-anchoring transpeptidase ErfK/SrfK